METPQSTSANRTITTQYGTHVPMTPSQLRILKAIADTLRPGMVHTYCDECNAHAMSRNPVPFCSLCRTGVMNPLSKEKT